MRYSQECIDDFISFLEPKPLEGGDYDKDMSVAYHEAGHAVIKLLYGQWPKHVTVIPQDESLGHVEEWDEYDLGPDKFFVTDPEEFNILLESDFIETRYFLSSSFGGVIAEAIYTGEYNWEQSEGDIENAIDKLASISSDLDIDLAREVFHETHDYLLSEWKTVQKVANDLLSRKNLSKEYFMTEIDWKSIRKYHDKLTEYNQRAIKKQLSELTQIAQIIEDQINNIEIPKESIDRFKYIKGKIAELLRIIQKDIEGKELSGNELPRRKQRGILKQR